MKGQSKRHSLFESLVNVVVGFGIQTAATFVALPWFGYSITIGESAGFGLIMTGVSIVRSYALRRLFNLWHLRNAG